MRLNEVTAMTRVGATPRLLFPALAAVAIVAPSLHAQEVEPPVTEEEAAKGLRHELRAGLRLDFATGMLSPGASLDLVMPGSHAWLSLQFLAEVHRWSPRTYDTITGRSQQYVGRVRLGLGTGQGPSVYALFEAGKGVVKVDPSRFEPSQPGDTYGLAGLGLGVGLTVQRVTTLLESVLGTVDNRYFYARLAVAIQYRLLGGGSPR